MIAICCFRILAQTPPISHHLFRSCLRHILCLRQTFALPSLQLLLQRSPTSALPPFYLRAAVALPNPPLLSLQFTYKRMILSTCEECHHVVSNKSGSKSSRRPDSHTSTYKVAPPEGKERERENGEYSEEDESIKMLVVKVSPMTNSGFVVMFVKNGSMGSVSKSPQPKLSTLSSGNVLLTVT